MLRKTRRTLATIFFVGITLLFLDFTGTAHRWLGWMAKVQFLPAVLALNVGVVAVLVVLTLIFGRIYCSVVCPLGVMQDIMARMGRTGKRNPYSYSKALSWLRYSVLALFVVAIAAGMTAIASLIAPYSAFGRIATHLLQPLYEWGNNLLAWGAERMDSYAFYRREVWLRSLPTLVAALGTLVLLTVLAWRNGRTYCNTICPVGTILGLLSRFSWLKIHFDEDKCRQCGLCSKNCKASCLDFKTMTVDSSRCVVCGNCLTHCKFDALHYTHKSPKSHAQEGKGKDADSVDTSRRSFLIGTAMATAAAAWAQKEKKVDGGLAVIEDKAAPERLTPLTPPGSLSAQNMAQHCTACQLCVSECPNDVLRPSAHLGTFMQPTMSYERGYCRPECSRCSRVCPTGAIKPIRREEKSSIQIGHAVWVKKNCVAITDGVDCGNCARHCPAGAIAMVPYRTKDGTEVQVPAVNTARCIGCGACEHLCPARPFPAIYVEGNEVHRTI